MINLCMPLFSKNICGEKILFNGNIFVEATRSIENKAISIKDKRINHIGEQDEFKMCKEEKVDLKKKAIVAMQEKLDNMQKEIKY